MLARHPKMDPRNGLSVQEITEFREVVKSDLKSVVYADYMMMTLSFEQRVSISVVVILLLVMGMFGNVASLWVNSKRKTRICFRACLLSLALSDILTVVFQSTSYLAQMSVSYIPIWVLGEVMCSAIPFFTTMALLANSLTLVAIALDRYVAVVKIVKSNWEPSGVLCGVFATAIWALAGAISSPMWNTYFIIDVTLIHTSPLNRSQEVDVSYVQSCASVKAPNLYYYSIVFLVIFLPLVMAFVWLNARIAKEIWRRRRPFESTSSTSIAPLGTSTCNSCKLPESIAGVENLGFENEDNSEEKRTSETNTASNEIYGRPVGNDEQPKSIQQTPTNVISSSQTSESMRIRSSREIRQLRMFRVILILITTFLVCRLPTWIYLLYKLENVANTNMHWILQYVFGILSIFNCVLNPFMYTFLMETIQCSFAIFDRITKVLRCRKCCGRKEVVDEPMVGMPNESGRVEIVEQGPKFYCSEDRKVKVARLD